ncbi:S4 domain-containing protein [Schleiferiaceae bacterium]|jgi:ribosome-associated heat shock protein Hsp15|nr:S4 domain-containing protein [Schleiferiaceae bacterium]MDA9151607.1 S4 domain-containing protein [Schleiferiaceae bacterium]MDC3353939.1 S4 domain-containing protein [Schleiferiaceae bacterium]
MRVDSFLWAVRLFKTRNLAADSIKLGRVHIQDQPIKASRVLKAGDHFTLKYTGFLRSFKVLDIPKSRVGAALVENFLLETTQKEELEKREMILLARKHQRNQGLGRPTKRDRRDLEDWI